MTRRRLALLVVILGALLSAVLFFASRPAGIATLEDKHGSVVRDWAHARDALAPAEIAARFDAGDTIETAAQSAATLRLFDGSRVTLEENTSLRFLEPAAGAQGLALDVAMGRATLEAGSKGLVLYTELGRATLEPGTRLAIERTDGGQLTLSVELGTAQLETSSGVRTLERGDSLTVDIGGAILDAPRNDAPEAPPGAAAGAPPTSFSAVVEGRGAEARDPGDGAWRPLAPGAAQLSAGVSLRLGRGSRLIVPSPEGTITLQSNGAYVVGAEHAAFVQATAGGVSLERGGPSSLSVSVPGGTLDVPAHGAAELTIDPQQTRLLVSRGDSTVSGAFGRETVLAGEGGILTRAGRFEVTGRGPRDADLLEVAGNSFVVHDPGPATAVGFELKDVCPAGGVVERLAPGSTRVLSSSRGNATANIRLAPGTHRYQVRCVDEAGVQTQASSSGTVTILRDAGNGVLSTLPPSTRIDTDGRTYTVTYQNLLPELVVRWPKAPTAALYVLTIESNGRRSVTKTQSPSHTFASGQVLEGKHTLTFDAGGQRSAPTRVDVSFDNAAPTARIRSPEESRFRPGDEVTVAGIAARGWSVSVAGRELSLDNQSRFSERLRADSEQRTLGLRFAHPRRGVHYYLRHAAGSMP